MKPVIYQVMTRLFGNPVRAWVPGGSREENGVGRFADFTPAVLGEISSLGFTHLWYTGVLEHARADKDHPSVVKGRAGSPYAITDYYDVNDDLASDPSRRLEEFRALVDRTHRAGMKVLIDFVPNHVSRAYRSDMAPEGEEDFGTRDDRTRHFARDNNFYWLPGESLVLPEEARAAAEEARAAAEEAEPWSENPARASGNDVFHARPGSDDWYETVKLNYGVEPGEGGHSWFDPIPDTWTKMYRILVYWAGMGVDGFRCDMAEMVPWQFWAWVIPRVKAEHPGLVFVAEIYNPGAYATYVNQGRFDYLYDKVGLYDALRRVVRLEAPVADVEEACRRRADLDPWLLDFIENHDEQRFSSPGFAGSYRAMYPALAASAGLGRGPWMVYFGQEWGEEARGAHGYSGDDGRTSIFDYIAVPTIQAWLHGGKSPGFSDWGQRIRLRDFHRRVAHDCTGLPVLAEGDLEFVPTGNPRLLAWVRGKGPERRLFAANFDPQARGWFRYAGEDHEVDALDCIWARGIV